MSCQLDLQPWYPSAERSRARADCLLHSLLAQIEADKRRALSTFGLRFADTAGVDGSDEIVDGVAGAFEWRPASQLPAFYSRRLRPAAVLSSSTSTFRLSRRGVTGGTGGARASIAAFRSAAALRRKPSTTSRRMSRPELAVLSRDTMMDIVDETPKRDRRQQPQHKRRRHPAGQPQTEPKPATAPPPVKSPAASNFASRLRQRLLQPIRRCLATSRIGNSGDSRSRSTPRLVQLRPRKSTSSVQLRVSDMFSQQKKTQVQQPLQRGKSSRMAADKRAH